MALGRVLASLTLVTGRHKFARAGEIATLDNLSVDRHECNGRTQLRHPPTVTCDIRIGTSGFHYKHWCGTFYPEKTAQGKMLSCYLQHFDTVELNNPFYRLPSESTFDNWREATPDNFVFAVKASRFITHNKKLKDPQNALDKFFPPVAHLGKKLGPVLFQLPPSWKVNLERLREFLEMLPRDMRYTFEFREHSWISEEVNSVLREFNAAFCIYELAGFQTPLHVTADFVYVRLHGPEPGKYQGSYSDERLSQWADQIREWSTNLKAVYVYFDNDQAGYAAQNAVRLRSMLRPDRIEAIA
jgi:uncharacterized protein YecE (DUF72 family)